MSDRDAAQPHLIRRTLRALGSSHAPRSERLRAASLVAAGTAAGIAGGVGVAVGGADAVTAFTASSAGHVILHTIAADGEGLLGAGSAIAAAALWTGATAPSSVMRGSNRRLFRRVRAASAAVTVGVAGAAALLDAAGLGGVGHVLVDGALVTGTTALGAEALVLVNGIGLRQRGATVRGIE